jgi:hypothetical protein
MTSYYRKKNFVQRFSNTRCCGQFYIYIYMMQDIGNNRNYYFFFFNLYINKVLLK